MTIRYNKLENHSLNEFRILVRKALFLNKDEEEMFYSIPESTWKEIFETNFNSELTYANNVILGHTEPIIHTETKYLERVKENIDNFDYALNSLKDHIKNEKKVIFITDFDNDGSMSQAIINQIFHVLTDKEKENVFVEYARSVGDNKNRGFTYELVNHLAKQNGLNNNDEFLIVTADNGINSRSEQIKINESFPNATLLITDHHNPEQEMMVIENEKTIIFNPHYFALEHTNPEILKARGINFTKSKQESYSFFKEYNVSGATTVGLLISSFIKSKTEFKNLSLKEQAKMIIEQGTEISNKNALKIIDDLSRMSNMIDYVKTAPADKPYNYKEINNASRLQTLLNINNSSVNLILNMIDDNTLNYIKSKTSDVDKFDIEIIKEENQKIMSLNVMAKALLIDYLSYLNSSENTKEQIKFASNASNIPNNIIVKLINDELTINEKVLKSDNPNYIEQLRPIVFELTVDDNKNNYQDQMLDAMIDIYEKLSISERRIISELRKSNLMEQEILENSTISIIDKSLQRTFNRKLLNKTYNGANNGFNLTIDNITDHTVSGSFRSLYDISDILTISDRKKISKKYGINIETPGHEQAAGFIITSDKKIELSIISEINKIINDKINKLKNSNEYKNRNKDIHFITDVDSLEFLSRFNNVIRGNIPHFAKIIPFVKINEENLVIINQKTGEQTLISDKIKEQDFGWVSIPTKLQSSHSNGEVMIVPIGALKRIHDSNYKEHLKLNFLNNGAFIGEKAVEINEEVPQIILNKKSENRDALIESIKDGKLNEPVHISREEIMDNPFFKFNPYKEEDFEKFEQVIIKIIESNNIDTYSIFDVEADGFGYARLLNIGFMNYFINEDENINNGITKLLSNDDFNNNVYSIKNKRKYYINTNNLEELIKNNDLKEINEDDFIEKSNNKSLSILYNSKNKKYYEYLSNIEIEDNKLIEEVKNFRITNDGKYLINRTIYAETMAYLVKPEDFIIPPTIVKLTGITNEVANQYGLKINEIDEKISNYFKDKTTLFIAHNTEYDGRICRANLPEFTKILNSYENYVADSAHFSKEYRLMYDNIDIVTFENIPGLNNYFFYNNKFSKFNLGDFINSDKEGEYPDIKNRIHIVKKLDEVNKKFDFYIRDMKDNTFIKLDIKIKELDKDGNVIGQRSASLKEIFFEKKNNIMVKNKWPVMIDKELPLNHVGYKAQGLGEMKFIRQMLLLNESFNVNIINDFSKYPSLLEHKEKLIEFQKEYRFNKTLLENISDFNVLYPTLIKYSVDNENFIYELKHMLDDFISKNKEIENNYNDTWYYQAVLSTFEPQLYTDLNKTNYELISSQTGIPIELVEEVLKAAYDFKQNYKKEGCKNVIQNETHMNGPYKGEIVGDIAYEDKATLMLLSDKFTTKFSDEIKEITEVFNKSQEQYFMSFVKQDIVSTNEISNDSMSYKQHKNYVQRDNVSKVMRNIENKHNSILFNDEKCSIVKFKLSEKILQDGKNIYAITNKGIMLDSEIIEEDAKKLSFILACQQIGSSKIKDPILNIYDYNMKKMVEYRNDLMKRYGYIEMNNSTELISDYIKTINSVLNSGAEDYKKISEHKAITVPKRANSSSGVECITKEQLLKVDEVLFHKLLNTLSKSQYNKEDIKKLSDAYKIGNFKTGIYKNEILDDLAEYLNMLNEFKNTKINEKAEEYKKTISKVNENIESYYIDNPIVNQILPVLMINALAINNKNISPSRLEIKMDKMNKDEHDIALSKDKTILESEDFLDRNHSIIKRQSTAKHLMEKLNYIDFSYKNIFEKMVKPYLTIDEIIKKQNKHSM